MTILGAGGFVASRGGEDSQTGVARWVALFVVVLGLSLTTVLGFRPLAVSRGWLVDGARVSSPPAALDVYRVPSPSPAPATEAPVKQPSSEAMTRALLGVEAGTDARLSAYVANLRTGEVLFEHDSTAPVVPASGIKLLTVTALLAKVAPDTTLTTSVKLAADGRVILVGGGDPSLRSEPAQQAHPQAASTRTLAQEAAKALISRGVTTAIVAYDDHLFSGPSWHPAWPPADELYVGDASALSVDGGFSGEGQPFSHTPSLDAATVFANQLREAGVNVEGPIEQVQTPADAETVARVVSPSLETLAIDALVHSDNTATEVLARHLALSAGQPASFDGVSAALGPALESLGLPIAGAVFADASGMASTNRVTASMLGRAVVHDAGDPGLSRVINGLPVAAASGTLRTRFDQPDTQAGRGWVRAKTGTLAGVGSLTGFAQTADGALVAFSFVLNEGTDAGLRPYLDRLTATVAACGC